MVPTRGPSFLVLLLLLAAPLGWAHTDGTAGYPKPYCEGAAGDEAVHDYGPGSLAPHAALDGSLANCHPRGGDDHHEFALGGAWLMACEAACGGDGTGDGAARCFGDHADHPAFPTVRVSDAALTPAGLGVAFHVVADHLDNLGAEPGGPRCGDFEADAALACVDACAVGFGPGLDGSYQVHVAGGTGHVRTG